LKKINKTVYNVAFLGLASSDLVVGKRQQPNSHRKHSTVQRKHSFTWIALYYVELRFFFINKTVTFEKFKIVKDKFIGILVS